MTDTNVALNYEAYQGDELVARLQAAQQGKGVEA